MVPNDSIIIILNFLFLETIMTDFLGSKSNIIDHNRKKKKKSLDTIEI
jgi:hypothetical protein